MPVTPRLYSISGDLTVAGASINQHRYSLYPSPLVGPQLQQHAGTLNEFIYGNIGKHPNVSETKQSI